MRKSLLIILILFMSFITVRHAFAQEVMLTPSPTPVQYTLPYPGLLPDSPLYKLKTFRDAVIAFLISDQTKKAKFDILQSDKRFAGAMMLYQIRPKELPLVIDTLSKGNNYMYQTIASLQLLKKQGMTYAETAHVASMSNAKHAEILQNLLQILGPNTSLERELQRTEDFADQIDDQIL